MRRNVAGLADETLDLLVIGGGVYGVCAAWEAARRGLKVGLIERDDFGGATSANSLHTMHGGLRYLQQLDIKRMRESIRERRFWLRAAPGLIQPLPFILPTFGHGLRGPEVMRTALLLNDLISADRNRGVEAAARLPRGRQLSGREARRRLEMLKIDGHNGAALWYDGFNRSPERLLVALLKVASDAGALAVNYCAAEGLHFQPHLPASVRARDQVSGQAVALQARCVLNAAGPWVDRVAAMAGRKLPQPLFRPSKALNLVVRRLPLQAAVGIPVPRQRSETDSVLDKGAATYFIVPWGEYSLIGTKHLRYCSEVDSLRVERAEVQSFLAEINPALGSRRLGEVDVLAIKCGLLPEREGSSVGDDVVLQKHMKIVDHEREDGIANFVSLVGVKWTTARLVAEQAINMVCTKLRYTGARSYPDAGSLCKAVSVEVTNASGTSGDSCVAQSAVAIDMQIRRAVRDEMAVTIEDVMFRRTDLWLQTDLHDQTVIRCANLMATELGWSESQLTSQIATARASLARVQAWRN